MVDVCIPELRPDESHRITIRPTPGWVRVQYNGRIIAQSTRALTLQESGYPPMIYLPFQDVDPQYLRGSEHYVHCPYKGDAAFFSLEVDGMREPDVIWFFPDPASTVSEIMGHVSFLSERVTMSIDCEALAS